MAYPTYNRLQISSAPTYRGGAFREMPNYSGPGWNEGEITDIAQRRAAPGLRALRTQLKRVTGGGEGATRRLSLRDALAGYGQGVGSVIGSASTAAGNEYGDKFSALTANAVNRYRGESEAARAFNERGEDIARANYGGEMAEWGARNAIETRAADLDYEGARRSLEADKDLEKTRYLTEEQAKRDARLFELGEKGKRSDYERLKAEREAADRTQAGRDQRLYELSEQGKKSDYQRWLDEQTYGEDVYQRRRREAEEQKKINYAWDKWKANNPIIPTNPLGNYKPLTYTPTR